MFIPATTFLNFVLLVGSRSGTLRAIDPGRWFRLRGRLGYFCLHHSFSFEAVEGRRNYEESEDRGKENAAEGHEPQSPAKFRALVPMGMWLSGGVDVAAGDLGDGERRDCHGGEDADRHPRLVDRYTTRLSSS